MTESYQCPVCKLHYRSKKLAEACFAWCSAHNSCNLSITKSSKERTGEFNGN